MSHEWPRDPRSVRGLAFGKIVHECCEALLAVAEARDALADAHDRAANFCPGTVAVEQGRAAVERALARHARATVDETRERARIRATFSAADALDVFRAAEHYVAQDARGRAMLEAL